MSGVFDTLMIFTLHDATSALYFRFIRFCHHALPSSRQSTRQNDMLLHFSILERHALLRENISGPVAAYADVCQPR